MKVNILDMKKESNSLEFVIEDEDHTLCNALRNILIAEESVEFVSYKIEHPTHANPIFYIKTNGSKTPTEALIDASDKLSGLCNEVLDKFQKALKS
ncbi:MAG: DNA-directed RNA polymerase subunit L [Candidatus Sifarchaeia archaeon]